MTDTTAAAGDVLYSRKAIAEFLGIPGRAVQNQIDQKRLPHFHMGGTVCARRSVLTAWLAELEAAPPKKRPQLAALGARSVLRARERGHR